MSDESFRSLDQDCSEITQLLLKFYNDEEFNELRNYVESSLVRLNKPIDSVQPVKTQISDIASIIALLHSRLPKLTELFRRVDLLQGMIDETEWKVASAEDMLEEYKNSDIHNKVNFTSKQFTKKAKDALFKNFELFKMLNRLLVYF